MQLLGLIQDKDNDHDEFAYKDDDFEEEGTSNKNSDITLS